MIFEDTSNNKFVECMNDGRSDQPKYNTKCMNSSICRVVHLKINLIRKAQLFSLSPQQAQ